ncbi:MAG: hypothetical protein MR523_03975 [Lachnospiraceae bacterium]|nr:hypothetical protein [Lachnospiraceae bacterium]
MEFSKSDWKLFRACIAEWQENYMERLLKEYIDMLNGNGIRMYMQLRPLQVIIRSQQHIIMEVGLELIRIMQLLY